MLFGSFVRHPGSVLLAGLTLSLFVGCGSDRPPIAEASGILTLDGEPVAEASVTILPVSEGRPASAITDAEGRFSLQSYPDADGAIVGDYKVSVIKISGPGAYALDGAAPPSEGEGEEDDGSDGLSTIGGDDNTQKKLETIYHVPQKYMDAATSGLTLTVPEDGTSELKIELTN